MLKEYWFSRLSPWNVLIIAPVKDNVPHDPRDEKKDDNTLIATASTFNTPWHEQIEQLEIEPHVYEVSSLAYRGLALEEKSQTIVICGESGSGKTETAKTILNHLSTIEAAALSSDGNMSNSASEDLVRRIMESYVILEAFGHAKTAKNQNSSRFGKVIKMNFQVGPTGMHGLRGSTYETFLLETNRVASHNVGERNFHIFYYLLEASSDVKNRLLGSEWKYMTHMDFKYLCDASDYTFLCSSEESSQKHQPGKKDADLSSQVIQALEFFQFSGEKLNMLMQALGIILRLGNLVFTDANDGIAFLAADGQLDELALAFGVDCDEIENALVRRTIVTSSKDEVCAPMSAEQAKEACDNFAKTIYARVFDIVVGIVNSQISALKVSDREQNVISLIDFFGFECLESNKFEQLCINYANEKLQQKYIQDILRRHTSEYEREGVLLCDSKMCDNSGILDLLESPTGVLNLLNAESQSAEGSNLVSELSLSC